jgi:dysferlin
LKKGEKSKSKDLFELRVNWKWVDDWNVDINRAVDNEGWEYCIDPSMGGWCPSEKMYHLIKRRRCIRNRVIVLSKEEISSSSQVNMLNTLSY